MMERAVSEVTSWCEFPSAVSPDKASCKSTELMAEGPVFVPSGVALWFVHWVWLTLGQLLLWEGFKTRAPYHLDFVLDSKASNG